MNKKALIIMLLSFLALGGCATGGFSPDVVSRDAAAKSQYVQSGEVVSIRNAISELGYLLEGELRSSNAMNIKRLKDIGTYKGIRHRRGLPVNGQRTKTNARTRKGKKRTIGLGKS